jgi:hypothetical protein
MRARHDRRTILRGLGGVAVGLPLLEAFAPRRAAAATRKAEFAAFVVLPNGVQQSGFGNEPDSFWPKATGKLDRAALMADPARATTPLANHGERLSMVRGLKFPYEEFAGHAQGHCMCLTAAKITQGGGLNAALALGESIDNRIARELSPGKEPLALFAGKKGEMGDKISYRGRENVRVAEANPWVAYQKLMGLSNAKDPAAVNALVARRKSVNDFVRADLKALLASPDLAAADRQRLDMHFTSIRDLELTMSSASLAPARVDEIKAIAPEHTSDVKRVLVERMQLDIMALAFASGATKVAYLQAGNGIDQITHTIDGETLPRFHLVSHRASSDSKVNDGTMPQATMWHHKIDVLNMKQLAYFLDKLASYQTPTGPLLDNGFVLWTNNMGTGNHVNKNIPTIVAGRAGGFLKTGQFFDAPGAINNKLLNVLLSAMGLRKPNGDPIDDFGDPGLAKGLLTQLVA